MAEAALVLTARGYGKLIREEDFPVRNRGGKGVSAFKVSEQSGPVVAVEHVQTQVGQHVLILTAKGMSLMLPVDSVTVRRRSAGGVKVMEVAEDDQVIGIVV